MNLTRYSRLDVFLIDNKLSSGCIVMVSYSMKGVIEKSRFCNSARVACYVS